MAKIARQKLLDDVTDSVGQTFLAHPLQCARCHDHKFDPIPTRDYYSFQAVFATMQLAERTAEFLPTERTEGFDEKKYLLQREEHYRATLNRLDKKSIAAAREWYREKNLDPAEFEAALTAVSGTKKKKNARGREVGFSAIRSEMMRKPLVSGLMTNANCSCARLIWPVILKEAASLSIKKLRACIKPLVTAKSLAMQFNFTCLSPVSLVRMTLPIFKPASSSNNLLLVPPLISGRVT